MAPPDSALPKPNHALVSANPLKPLEERSVGAEVRFTMAEWVLRRTVGAAFELNASEPLSMVVAASKLLVSLNRQ